MCDKIYVKKKVLLPSQVGKIPKLYTVGNIWETNKTSLQTFGEMSLKTARSYDI